MAETAGSADRTAHMPSVQALIFLAGALVVRNGCTDIEKSGAANLRHLARLDLVAVWQMVDSLVAVLELV